MKDELRTGEHRYPWQDNARFADFIEDRGIAPEDYRLIDRLVGCSKQTVILLLHNHFNTHRERSLEEIGRMTVSYQSANLPYNPDMAEKLNLLKDFQIFAQKYDWTVCYGLERILEDN